MSDELKSLSHQVIKRQYEIDRLDFNSKIVIYVGRMEFALIMRENKDDLRGDFKNLRFMGWPVIGVVMESYFHVAMV